jgi:hypothetical protein
MARDRINGAFGDTATKAQEELKVETGNLVAEMRSMRQNGVPLRLADY